MTTFWLIRHGSTDALDRQLCGRMPGVPLNELGEREVVALAERIAASARRAHIELGRVYTSPLERALMTARALAERVDCGMKCLDDLAELEFGEWTGVDFQSLQSDPRWERFNRFRSGTQIPAGESMLGVSARAVRQLLELRDQHGDETLVVVSHGDVIKAAVMHFLGIPLDFCHRLVLAPASITHLELDEHGARLVSWNDTSHLPARATKVDP
jgi:probable phosphoglycerate mutase